MQDEERLSDEEQATADALARLRPAAIGFDARQILMEAVRRSARRQVWAWRGIAAALAGGLVLALVLRPQPRTVREVVYKPAPTMPAPQESTPLPAPASEQQPPLPKEPAPIILSGDSYLALRNRVLAYGLDALPSIPVASGHRPPPTWQTAAPVFLNPPPTSSSHWLDVFRLGGRS